MNSSSMRFEIIANDDDETNVQDTLCSSVQQIMERKRNYSTSFERLLSYIYHGSSPASLSQLALRIFLHLTPCALNFMPQTFAIGDCSEYKTEPASKSSVAHRKSVKAPGKELCCIAMGEIFSVARRNSVTAEELCQEREELFCHTSQLQSFVVSTAVELRAISLSGRESAVRRFVACRNLAPGLP
jgi:hypothetical protein